jgi:Uncharacterized conserved protein
MEKKTIVARAEVLPGKEKDFLLLAETLISATRTEAGNISYNLYQNPFSPSSFIFYEEYKNQEAISAHGSSKHFLAFSDAVGSLLAEDLIIETF